MYHSSSIVPKNHFIEGCRVVDMWYLIACSNWPVWVFFSGNRTSWFAGILNSATVSTKSHCYVNWLMKPCSLTPNWVISRGFHKMPKNFCAQLYTLLNDWEILEIPITCIIILKSSEVTLFYSTSLSYSKWIKDFEKVAYAFIKGQLNQSFKG